MLDNVLIERDHLLRPIGVACAVAPDDVVKQLSASQTALAIGFRQLRWKTIPETEYLTRKNLHTSLVGSGAGRMVRVTGYPIGIQLASLRSVFSDFALEGSDPIRFTFFDTMLGDDGASRGLAPKNHPRPVLVNGKLSGIATVTLKTEEDALLVVRERHGMPIADMVLDVRFLA